MEVDYKAIGKRVRIARTERDIKQETLAEMVGISPPHMSNVETGRTKLSLPTLISLANALHVSVDALLCDNVLYSKAVYENEAQALLNSSTEYEIRVMVRVMEAARRAMRENEKFGQ